MRYVGGLLVYAMIFFCVFTGLFAIVAQIGGVKFPGWGYIIGFTLGSTFGRACFDGYLLSLRHNRDETVTRTVYGSGAFTGCR